MIRKAALLALARACWRIGAQFERYGNWLFIETLRAPRR